MGQRLGFGDLHLLVEVILSGGSAIQMSRHSLGSTEMILAPQVAYSLFHNTMPSGMIRQTSISSSALMASTGPIFSLSHQRILSLVAPQLGHQQWLGLVWISVLQVLG